MPSSVRWKGVSRNGSGYISGLEKWSAAFDCEADKRFTTMCGVCGVASAVNDDAMREGVRIANATRGRGCMEMDVNDDRVAP